MMIGRVSLPSFHFPLFFLSSSWNPTLLPSSSPPGMMPHSTDGSNWSDGVVPGEGSAVIIDDPNAVVRIKSAASVAKLSAAENSTVLVEESAKLTVAGDATFGFLQLSDGTL